MADESDDSSRGEELAGGGAKPRVGKPFAKGRSGNPGGRAKGTKGFRELCRKGALEGARVARKILKDETAPKEVRLAAARLLADHGFGRPATALTLGNPDGSPFVPGGPQPSNAITALLDRIRARQGAAGGGEGQETSPGGSAPPGEAGAAGRALS